MTRSAFAPSAFALAALIVLGAAQAHAEGPVVHVPAHGLNLAKAADADTLARRIRTAALDVCGAPIGSGRSVVEEAKQSACYRDALSTAMASLPSVPKLAAR